MRKNFLFALVGIIAMLTSCNKEEVGSLTTNRTTSFNVSVDGGVKTRAAVTDLTRYVMEVYKGATAATGTLVMHKEQATGVFSDIVLDNGQAYTVLFWADYGTPSAGGTHNVANEYNAADLKVAKVAKQPTEAAYSGVSKFTVGTTAESAYTNVELKHAVAQVNFAQTEKLTSATNTLTVSYPESYSLNVEDNAVTKIDGAVTHNFTYNNDAAGTLGTSYIIAATGTPKTVMEITATLNSETVIPVSNVPFERNYKTNISGAYSSKYSTVLTVTCSDDWGILDNDVEIPAKEPSITWATGNLVAKSDNSGCEIGNPTDNGLYFQFGSLIGWSPTGDPTIVVKPSNFNSDYEDWSNKGKIWQGTTGTVPFTEAGSGSSDEMAGIGDPCRYYLGGTWRLPTKDEYVALFNNTTTGWTGATDWSWVDDTNSATHTDGLTFTAASYRLSDDGGLVSTSKVGFYWSATPYTNTTNGYRMSFNGSVTNLLTPKGYINRVNGLSVRCVSESN